MDNYRPIISKIREVGIFNPKQWKEESEIQLKSSYILRDAGTFKSNEIKITLQKISDGQNDLKKKVIPMVFEKEAAYKSSVLLFGYALELLLKSGIIHFYRGLPKLLIKKTLKKYGHRLDKMAIALALNLSGDEKQLLKDMQDIIENEGRYPIEPEDENVYSSQWNELNRKLQDNEFYNKIKELYQKISHSVKKIDQDTYNPASIWGCNIDHDGYLVYRIGGNIPSRLTVKYSTEQIDNGENTIKSLKGIIEIKVSSHLHFKVILKNWKTVELYEHFKDDILKCRNEDLKRFNNGNL